MVARSARRKRLQTGYGSIEAPMNPLPTPIEVFDALVALLGPQTFYSTIGERGEGIALLLDQAVNLSPGCRLR